MRRQNVVVIDNDRQSLNSITQQIKNLGFQVIPITQLRQIKSVMQHCHHIVAVICNLKDQSMPNIDIMNQLKKKKIPVNIFSDIPGITYVNNHFATGIQFFKGPANRFLLKYCLNELMPGESPKQNLPIKKQILNKLLKNLNFNKVLQSRLKSHQKN